MSETPTASDGAQELFRSQAFIEHIDSDFPQYLSESKDFVRRDLAGNPIKAYWRLVEAMKQTSDPDLLRGLVINLHRAARYDAHHLGVSIPEVIHAIAMRGDEQYANYDSADEKT